MVSKEIVEKARLAAKYKSSDPLIAGLLEYIDEQESKYAMAHDVVERHRQLIIRLTNQNDRLQQDVAMYRAAVESIITMLKGLHTNGQ